MNLYRKQIYSLHGIIYFLIIFMFLHFSTLCYCELLDRIVAIVGNRIILKSEIDERLYLLELQGQLDSKDKSREEFEKQTIEEFITKLLVIQAAEKAAVQVSREEVATALNNAIEDIKKQFPSEQAFLQQLQKENLTFEELKQRYEEEIKESLIQEKFLGEKVYSTISVEEKEILQYYNLNKNNLPKKTRELSLKHILLIKDAASRSRDKVIEELKQISGNIKNFNDFEKYAKLYSVDTGSGQNGGLLGFFEKGTLVPEFEENIRDLEPGMLSQIFETPLGFHLAMLDEKNDRGYTVHHILLKPVISPGDIDMIKSRALSVLAKLKSGELSFENAVVEYSDESETRDKQGDLGFLPADKIPSPFQDQLFALKPGEITDLLESDTGFHIFKLSAIKGESVPTLEDSKTMIQQVLRMKKMQEALNQFIEDLKNKTYIKIIS